MKKLTALFLMFCMMATLFTLPSYALQDPLVLSIDSVAYGENQDTLIAKGFFVNTSNTSILSITDVQLEISVGADVIASQTFDVVKMKTLSLSVGDAVAWEFVFKNPVKGKSLSSWTSENRIRYNLGQAQELSLGKKVFYRGLPIQFDVKPVVLNGRLMIPARAVFEKMGGYVTWNDASKSLEVTRGATKVIIFVDNPIITVNGKPVKLDVPATIIDGRTLVPLRAISNALGAGIVYGELNEMAVVYE